MNPYIREIILDKRTAANDLGDVLLECEVETVEPIMEIIDKEIGQSFEEELDIFDWINEANKNNKMLRSLAFQEEWWIIHKKLRRMIRKNEYIARINAEKQRKEALLNQSKGWNSMHEVIRHRLNNKSIDEKIQIANAFYEHTFVRLHVK